MEQKTVELLTLEVNDYRVIKVAKLDFAKWKNQGVIEVIGDIGNGKSSLLEALAMGTTGTDHIKDKSLLEKGFKSEVCLSDGDHQIYMGVKVSEYSRGAKKGESKFETYIYEYDKNGKVIQNPTIDGVSSSAKEYSEMLSTALTFRMSDLFSENQPLHRKLIESLFAKELHDLGVEEILEAINTKRDDRDKKRHERDRLAATMVAFEEEGYTKEKLEVMEMVPVEPIEKEITELEVEKGILLKNPEKEKEAKLSKIREEGREIVEKVRAINEKKQAVWLESHKKWQELEVKYKSDKSMLMKAQEITDAPDIVIPDGVKDKLLSAFSEWANLVTQNHSEFIKMQEPKLDEIIPIVDGKMQIPDMVPSDYTSLISDYNKILKDYKDESEKDTFSVGTDEVDKRISAKRDTLKVAQANNEIVTRFQAWADWIEADGLYQKEVDNLRKLYTKIDTGVEGLFIQPNLTDSGRLEIWMEYDGSHDPKLFGNTECELRRLYEYSKSQRAIVGVLLQAARLDKKEKALRLVVLDDYTQTKKGKDLLEKICQEKNLKLIISKTEDRIKVEDLDSSQILVENGQLLLNE